MGSVLSSDPERGRDAVHVTSESVTMNKDLPDNDNAEEEFHDAANEDEDRARAKEEKMNEFRKMLSIKREQRKEILTRHRKEKEQLEKSLKDERNAKLELSQKNEQLREILLKNNIDIPDNLQPSESSELSEAIHQMREEFDKLRADNLKLRRDLAEANNSLQGAYADMADLNGQNIESMKQIQALKEVVSVSKTLIGLREGQLNELKEKLGEIERSLSEREANMLSVDLRQEYERQLQNIRTLRGLYEERARLAEVSRQGLLRDLEEQKTLYQIENNKCKDLVAKVEALEAKADALEETILNKNNDIRTCQEETNGLKAEMAVVNKLFSQVLLGYKTRRDLDKLELRLKENHGLLTHMAEKEDDAEASSALPKLLLELVSQVDDNEESDEYRVTEKLNSVASEAGTGTELPVPSTTAEEIVENLPKVWRVLMELLSHQTVAEDTAEKVTTCYKSVETKSGPVLVPSVSQTYIRLKDLIVEKLGLIKEVNRMKQLNSHLENRLQEQERRLCLVTTELGKTWHVVGKLRRHHYQLHTHEKILKYELQQKRKLLNELKEELEYCREKWEQAREKNTQSEKDWRKLRAEFTSRKTKLGSPSFNNSGESGYSDERPSDDSSESNDESEYVAEPLNRCKKKFKKSFDNVLDSSADCNLAEREDPVSDMLDVADLPLDTQDGEASSECSKSEHFQKSEKTCETEDEIGDITHDEIITEDTLTTSKPDNNGCETKNVDFVDTVHSSTTSQSSSSAESQTDIQKLFDPAAILLNVRKQDDRLAKRDERLEKLEKSSADLLKKTLITTKISQELNSTLDHLINRPTSSLNTHNTFADINQSDVRDTLTGTNNLQSILDDSKIEHATDSNTNDLNNLTNEIEKTSFSSSTLQDELASSNEQDIPQSNTSQTPIVDYKAILESIKKQDDRLAKKDEKLLSLEHGCAEVVQNLSSTLDTSDKIVEKLDALHNKHSNEDQTEASEHCLIENALQTTDTVGGVDGNTNISEPSTSSEIDHEARFAARDLRLKRLEEQTKSLVKKVNKTTSKGVKINYKLDELHNIYGSESSRAGTPSEDTEDRSIDEDNESTE